MYILTLPCVLNEMMTAVHFPHSYPRSPICYQNFNWQNGWKERRLCIDIALIPA